MDGRMEEEETAFLPFFLSLTAVKEGRTGLAALKWIKDDDDLASGHAISGK